MSLAEKVAGAEARVREGLARQWKRARMKFSRLDREKILHALEGFGEPTGDVILMHSSLSACGYVEGGAATVIEALKDWAGERRALAVPTHTWSYPEPQTGVAPLFDRRETPSVVGAITNHFWRHTEGAVRSLHPSHSLACAGPDAAELCAGHELIETPCGAGTPYDRLVARDASVLMFGATMDSYTLFHTAEDAACLPYLYMPEKFTLRTRLDDGSVREVCMWRQDMGVTRRFEATASWLEGCGLLKRRRLGMGELLYIPRAGRLHSVLLEELKREPLLLVAESARAETRRLFKL
jgi:aminoglycoside 3-N-acetyltransferase